jgi:rhomboid protease GluP
MIRIDLSSKKYMITFIIIGINVIMYAYTALLSQNVLAISDPVLEMYGQNNYMILNGGWKWYWQLFTAMFVHLDIVHVGGNMFFLLIFGLRAEELFSLPEYLLIYLGGGLAGNLLTLLVGPLLISAGASGAIFALFGAVTIYLRKVYGQSILGGLMFAFLLFLISAGLGVNLLAHLGGLVVGVLAGFELAASRRQRVTFHYQYQP